MHQIWRQLRIRAGRLRRSVCDRYDGELLIFPAGQLPPGDVSPPAAGCAISELTRERLAAHPEWGGNPPGIREKFAYYLDRGHRILIATDASGNLCGWGMVNTGQTLLNPGGILLNPRGTVMFHTLFVLPEYRGHGLGRALDLAQLRLLQPGQTAFCFVRSGNRPALRSWEALGFTPALRFRCRRWFNRPWRHEFFACGRPPAAIPVEPPFQIRINGPAAAWAIGDIRILRRPPEGRGP